MKYVILACALALMSALPAAAQMVETSVKASNGVSVSVNTDEFAGRYEYASPKIDLVDGYALVAAVKTGTADTGVIVMGGFVYSGDWRFYDSAVFRGGAEAEYLEAGRTVGRCSASRYSNGCTLNEGFRVVLTPEQIQQYGNDGVVAVQIRSRRTTNVAMLQIPIAYLDAVREVSARH